MLYLYTMETIYIYSLKNPITNEIRYIGKTGNLHRRLQNHISHSKTLNTRIGNWIKSLIKENLLPIIQVIEECNENNWEEKEIYWIQYYKDLGCNLVNFRKGGNEPPVIKKQYQKFTKVKDKYVVKRSKNNKLYYLGTFSTQTEAINAYNNFEIKDSVIYNTNGVLMFQNNLLIKEFKSISECAKYINGATTHISACCKNKKPQYKGYTFKYKNHLGEV